MEKEIRKLLFLGANPPNTSNIKVVNELDTIKDSISLSNNPDFELEVFDFILPQFDKLTDLFNDIKPDYLHIASHGSVDGNLVISNSDGDPAAYSSKSLADTLKVAGNRPKLIVLNACRSSIFAEEISEYADCVIGTTDSLPSDKAIEYSRYFYRNFLKHGLTRTIELSMAHYKATFNDNPYKVYPLNTLATGVFVVQPVGDTNTETRTRAEKVFNDIIKPVCEEIELDPIRAHELSSHRITEPIVNSLRSSRLVIADLGEKKPWNANVLTEIGYRLATGRPLVILADTTDDVPALFSDRRIFKRGDPIQKLIDMCEEAMKTTRGWESNYPTVEISVGGDDSSHKYIYANESAAKLFHKNSPEEIIGQNVTTFDEELVRWMPDGHAAEFQREQDILFSQCLLGPDKDVRATIPLWFTSPPDGYHNSEQNCFLPILTQKSQATNTRGTVLRVLFFPIHDWIQWPTFDNLKLPADFITFETFPNDLLRIENNTTEDELTNRLRLYADTSLLRLGFTGNDAIPFNYDSNPELSDLMQEFNKSRIIVLFIARSPLPVELQMNLVTCLTRLQNDIDDIGNRICNLSTKPVVLVHTEEINHTLDQLVPQLREKATCNQSPWLKIKVDLSAEGNENTANEATMVMATIGKYKPIVDLFRQVFKQELIPR